MRSKLPWFLNRCPGRNNIIRHVIDSSSVSELGQKKIRKERDVLNNRLITFSFLFSDVIGLMSCVLRVTCRVRKEDMEATPVDSSEVTVVANMP